MYRSEKHMSENMFPYVAEALSVSNHQFEVDPNREFVICYYGCQNSDHVIIFSLISTGTAWRVESQRSGLP